MFVDEQLWIREGEMEVIPGTEGEYYLENHQFLMELYDEDNEVFKNAIESIGGEVVETFESWVTLVQTKRRRSPEEDNEYRIRLSGLETKHVTGLTVRKDYTLSFLIIGGVIFMVGLVQGSYWTHRRIWLLQEEGFVILAATQTKIGMLFNER